MLFFPLEKPHFWMLDKSLIATQYLLNLSRISRFFSIPLNRYLDPSSLFPKVFVCSIKAWHLLDLSRQFCHQYLHDTSLIYWAFFLNTILIPSQSIKVRPDSLLTQIFPSYSLLSRSKPTLFTKNLIPSSSSNPLVSSLNLFFSSSFMHLDLGFRFWENNWGFCGFAEFFGMGLVLLLSYDHALHSLSLYSYFHAFKDCVLD